MKMRRRSTGRWFHGAVLLMAGAALLATNAGTAGPEATAESYEAPEAALAAAETIRGARVASRVRFLSSRFFEGREAGTEGERLTAQYLRDFYVGLELAPAGLDGSYFQPFALHERTLADGNALTIRHAGEGGASIASEYRVGEEFVPFIFSPTAEVDAPIVFAGYGIRSEKHDWDDYADVDVRDKVVLVLRHEPGESDPGSKFNGLRATKHAAFVTKARLAQELGAAGLILVDDPANHPPETFGPGNSLARWHSLIERDEDDRRAPPEPYQYYPEIAPDVRIPVVHADTKVAIDMLARVGVDLAELQRQMDEEMQPASMVVEGVRASLRTAVDVEEVGVRNVVAKLEGSDPALKDEIVVIGGHLDHVGYDSWGRLHPGADDNASGTAAILSIAEAMALATERPRRTIVFAHFTAEEKGLMGSRWFVEHPTIDLEKTVAMLNLDMVGRNDPSEISLIPDGGGKGIDTLAKRLASTAMTLKINNDAGSGVARSDQWSFALKGIPAAAFFSGVHDDYHRPGDTAGKIVPEKLQNVSRLVALTAWGIADEGAALIVKGSAQESAEAGGRASGRERSAP